MARDSGFGGGCLTFIIFVGFVIFSNIQAIVEWLATALALIIFVGLLLWGFVALINCLCFNKNIQAYKACNKEKKVIEKRKEDELLNIFLKECRQEGSGKEIEELKNLIEQNIKMRGSDIEFLELNFSVAKIYNSGVDSSKATIYFEKVKSIISHFTYKDLCLVIKDSLEKNNFSDAIFYYTYILLYHKVKDNKEIPEIYYNRALAYFGYNQNYKAINDIKKAIDKSKEIANTLRYIEVKAFLDNKLDKYNFKLGEIYERLEEYKDAIKYYELVSNNSTLHSQVQNLISTCEQKKLEKYQKQATESYQISLEEYKKGNFVTADKLIRDAIYYYSEILNNAYNKDTKEQIDKCEKLQLDVKNELKKQEQIAQIHKQLVQIQKNKEKAEKYFNLGLKKTKEYNIEEALKYFDTAINLDSKNAKYYYHKGLLYNNNFNPNKAKGEITKAINIEPDNALYYYQRAEINYFQKNYNIAINDYEKAYQIDSCPQEDFLRHMENCLSIFLNSGNAQARHYYLHAKLLINKKDAEYYIYSTAINELDKAIRRYAPIEYYILRAYAYSKYLLSTRSYYSLDQQFENLIKDLQKIKNNKSDNIDEPNMFLKTNYKQLLDLAKRQNINQSLKTRFESLYNGVMAEIEANKIKNAKLKIKESQSEEVKESDLAESYYIMAQYYFDKAQLIKAKSYITQAIDISKQKKYTTLLNKISNKENEKWNKKVKQVEKYIKDKSLDNAIISLKELLKINPASQEVKEKLEDVNNHIKQAEGYYKKGLQDFETGNLEDAKIQINSALNINNIEKYSELQSHILKYEKCLQDVSNQNYKEADRLIKGLISSFPDNQVFIDLSHDIKNKLINYLHKLSLQNINDGNFEEAQKKIKQIIKMNPDNEEEYQSLLDMANNQMVNIKTCNIGAILTLEGFNESKAKQFIKEREIINWYDLESFGEYFNLQPHEIIGNSDRIIFPLKPQVKKGRAVEF